MLYRMVRPFLFRLDPERAHGLTIAALKRLPRVDRADDPILATTLAGLRLPNPVGLAAGFDKQGEVPDALLSLGFGWVELGTVTPRPQPGNPSPRLFRLVEDQGVINRFGFNSHGHDEVRARLERWAHSSSRTGGGIVGVNLGANKDATDRIADYAAGVRRFAGLADYLTINISSPNTPGLRQLQGGDALPELLAGVMAEQPVVPVFLKVAPDLERAEIDAIVRAAIDHRLAGIITGNTTTTRDGLASRHRAETGGLSGRPLAALALARLRDFRAASGGQLPLVAAGGIASADDAWERLRAGASAIQLYSALVYEGPGLARRIAQGLAARLRREGLASVAELVGQD